MAIPLSGLKLWLKADAITGVTDNSKFGTWADSSGSGSNATQTVVANQPTYRNVNGEKFVRFNGNNFFNFPNFMSGATAGEVFIVVKIDSDPAVNQSLTGLWKFSNCTGSAFPSTHYKFPDNAIYDGFGSSIRKELGSVAVNLASSYRIYNVQSAANSWIARLNKTQIFSTTSNAVQFSTAPTLGTSVDSAFSLAGGVKAVLIYNRILTPAERTQVESDLTAAYFIPFASFISSPAIPYSGKPIQFLDTSANNPTGWSWNFGDGQFSSLQNPIKVFDKAGTYLVALDSINANGSTSFNREIVVKQTIPGLQFWMDVSQEPPLANGQGVSFVRDYSGNERTFVGASPNPVYQVNSANGKPAIYFNGAANPLNNNSQFNILCGFVVARYEGATFANFAGLLTDLTFTPILVGNPNDNKFFNSGYEIFEFRANDAIYEQSNQVAPMNVYSVIFFRFWKGASLNGIQIGQDRGFTDRKWRGSIAEIKLYDRQFCESEIRAESQTLATKYGLTLADVFPFPSNRGRDLSISDETLVFRPRQGTPITKLITDWKQSFRVNAQTRRQKEFDEAVNYLKAHSPSNAFIFRDHSFVPPRDVTGYREGGIGASDPMPGLFDYSFNFREK